MYTTDRMAPHARTWGEPIHLTRSAVADLPENIRLLGTKVYRDIFDASADNGNLSEFLRAVVRLSELGGYRP